MNDVNIEGTLYSISMDSGLDRLVRSNDPSLQKMVEDKIKSLIQAGGRSFRYTVSANDFRRLTHIYGEQYVADAYGDLDQYFDIVNGRLFARSIPTQLAVLYLFGSGTHYRPNTGALSAAGEGVAGFCMEQFGYRPLVRPLGVMPDMVSWASRAEVLHLALVEAKASTRQEPHRLIEKNAAQFLLDIKTRAQGFSYRYEGYLVASHFHDGRRVRCACLHVDLARYSKTDVVQKADLQGAVPSFDQPEMRLEAIIRLQAETYGARDEYLTSLLSEEASRTAMLELIFQRKSAGQDEVEAHVEDVASKLGLVRQWEEGQQLIKDLKAKERGHVSTALVRFRKPGLELE